MLIISNKRGKEGEKTAYKKVTDIVAETERVPPKLPGGNEGTGLYDTRGLG